MATVTFTYSMRHPLTVNGSVIRCPGRGPSNNPRQLTLMADGSTVRATCGERHRGPDGEKPANAQCFWPVDWIAPATLKSIAQQAKPGEIRVPLPSGKVLKGVLAEPKKPAAGGNTAAQRAAAALQAKGKGGKGMTMPNRSGGGALTAALNAVTATVTAAGNVASSAASMAESASSLGREGLSTARSGITAADNYGYRRHQRKMRKTEDDEE